MEGSSRPPVTPKSGVQYMFDGSNNAYATAAKGFRVGGYNPRLTINGSLFYIKGKNIQQFVNLATCNGWLSQASPMLRGGKERAATTVPRAARKLRIWNRYRMKRHIVYI